MIQTLKQKQAIAAYTAHRSKRSEFRQAARASGRQLDIRKDQAVHGPNPHDDNTLLYLVAFAVGLIVAAVFLGIV